MASERQTRANRRNARQSTGPRTPEGRSASRLNGLVHGLRSQLTVIPGENPEEFQALFDGFVGEAQPLSLRDLAAVRKIASCEWRLRRVAAIENEMFTQTLHLAATLGSAPDAFSFVREQLRAAPSAPPPPPGVAAPPLTLIARRFLAGEISRFTALSRYEASLERQYRNAWRELDSRPEPLPCSNPESTTQFEDICWTFDPATDGQEPVGAPAAAAETEPVFAAQPEKEQPNPIPKSDTTPQTCDFAPANPAETPILDPNQPASTPQSTECEPVAAAGTETARPNPIPKSDTTPAPCQPVGIDPYGPRPEDLRAFIQWVHARADLVAASDPGEPEDELDSAA